MSASLMEEELTFKNGVSKRTVLVQDNFLVLRLDEVTDDVRRTRIAS